MKSIIKFYNDNKERLPFSLPILREFIKKNLDRLEDENIIIVRKGKINTYRILDDDVLVDKVIKGF